MQAEIVHTRSPQPPISLATWLAASPKPCKRTPHSQVTWLTANPKLCYQAPHPQMTCLAANPKLATMHCACGVPPCPALPAPAASQRKRCASTDENIAPHSAQRHTVVRRPCSIASSLCLYSRLSCVDAGAGASRRMAAVERRAWAGARRQRDQETYLTLWGSCHLSHASPSYYLGLLRTRKEKLGQQLGAAEQTPNTAWCGALGVHRSSGMWAHNKEDKKGCAGSTKAAFAKSYGHAICRGKGRHCRSPCFGRPLDSQGGGQSPVRVPHAQHAHTHPRART